MAKKKSISQKPIPFTNEEECPPFQELLENPIVKQPLPQDFKISEEVKHLQSLWPKTPKFGEYTFDEFVHAGGSGIVFKVIDKDSGNNRAIKIARKKLFLENELPKDTARSLSPVSDRELKALQNISHPNVVRLFDAVSGQAGVIAIITSFVEDPLPLDDFVLDVLSKSSKKVNPFSPSRIDKACKFLVQKFIEIASALQHMHSLGYYHFDVKPANILISKNQECTLADLGSCIHQKEFKTNKSTRVHFTWTYAHPDLTNIVNNPAEISGGGLKSSTEIRHDQNLSIFDLYSFGRTIQEILAILENDFGERSHASYSFKFLHFISSLLLDGRNSPSRDGERIAVRDGKRFINDIALGYPTSIFDFYKIHDIGELHLALTKFSRQYSWFQEIPELDPWHQDKLNTGIRDHSPFTKRVASIMGHPALMRLKNEPQLGWIREVFPGATHNRWSHSIGVFTALVSYINSLLYDPDNPAIRILISQDDILHALVASLIHDVGQFSFGHDLEAACPDLFDHERILERILEERSWSDKTLKETIEENWKNIDFQRIKSILSQASIEHPIDGISRDIISGPIDADKFDYVARDSQACGVPYGRGIDSNRFMQALSVSTKRQGTLDRFALAYKAKGTAAIESLLLARYQMYAGVYWHHTFRCIQAMFSHAAASTFHDNRLNLLKVSKDQVKELIYQFIICNKSVSRIQKELDSVPKELLKEPPSFISDKAIKLVWKFADTPIQKLLEHLSRRDLFKRVYEISIGEFHVEGFYFKLKEELAPENRIYKTKEIEKRFINAIDTAMVQRSNTVETKSENEAKKRLKNLKKASLPRIIIDFPTKGVPDETNIPFEISDSARKYLFGPVIKQESRIFSTVNKLQMEKAIVRIYASPDLHEMIIRYLEQSTVEACITEVIPSLSK